MPKSKTRWLYLVTSGLDGYGVYAGMVVCAESEQQAANIHPSSRFKSVSMEFFDPHCTAKMVIGIDDKGFFQRTRHFYKGYKGGRKGESKLLKEKYRPSKWAKHPRDVTVTLIGEANCLLYAPGDIVITDYHVG